MARKREQVVLTGKPTDTKHTAISPARYAAIKRLVIKGWSADEIACKLRPRSRRGQRLIRGQVQRVVAEDEELQALAGAVSRGVVLSQAQEITEAVAKRALRGRVDAAKFLFALSGIYNDKVQHQHSGEIELRMVAVPRPDPVDNTPQRRQLDEPIPDAEVVEE